jgi:murein DD-endopeptidase MepM/ murein hydrolase activator NlpD
MNTLIKRIKVRFGKGFTLMIVPNSSRAIKSCKMPFPVVLIIAFIVICNIYIFFGFIVQSWKIYQFKQALNDKDQKIVQLIKEQQQIKPTLQKSYQINSELNRLKRERARLLERWKVIQQKSGRSVYSVSRGVNVKVPAYQLYSTASQTDSTNLTELNHNLEQLQKYIQIETKEQEKLLRAISEYEKRIDYIPSLNPVGVNRITSLFGRRLHPKYGYSHLHTGIDLRAAIGTRIKAAAAGKVTFTGNKSGYGNMVIIDHGYGYQTYYAHNSKIIVKIGQSVKKGQIICYSGNSGTSTGPHLHYEVRINGEPVNPMTFLKN